MTLEKELATADIAHLVIFILEETEDAASEYNNALDNTLIMNLLNKAFNSTDYIKAR